MASKFASFSLTWYDNSTNYGTNSDITSDVVGAGLFTDTGSGEVNELEFSLSAKGGKYLNSGSVILDKHDRFSITVTDLEGNIYGPRYFEIIDWIPTQTKGEGATVRVKCLGTEYHTQAINYAKRDWFQNAFVVAKNIGDSYTDPTIGNKGSNQPTLQRHDTPYSTANKYGNALPLFTNNHYEFGLAEDSHYNRWMDMVDVLGGSAASGGVGDFFELGFDTPAVNFLDIAIFSSGGRSRLASDDGNHVTIKNTVDINLSEQEGGISNPTATKVLAWGSPNHGSLPTGLSKYRGGELEFIFRPEWNTGIPYLTGSKVTESGKHYEAQTDHTSGTFATDLGAGDWSQIDMGDEFGDTIQYSEWTDDKATLWANGGTDPTSVTIPNAWATSIGYGIGDLVTESTLHYTCIEKHDSGTFATDLAAGKWEEVENPTVGTGAGFFDSNIVVRDHRAFRVHVHEVIGDTDYDGTTDTTLAAQYLHTNNTHPLGHRLLNVNTNTVLSGTDRNGNNFADAIVEWREQKGAFTSAGGEWVVVYAPDSSTDRMEVACTDTGTIWEWNNSISKWEDITTSGSVRTDDCFHQYSSLYNVVGKDPRPNETDSTKYPEVTKNGSKFAKNLFSAVEVAYQFGPINQKPKTALDHTKGAWLSFQFPYPVNTYNNIEEGVGDLYGGGTNEKNPAQPSFLDTENMSWTHDGLLGFNHTSSEDLGAIQSLSFAMRLGIWESVTGNALDGTVIVRASLFDSKDNVVTQDFEMKFTDGRTWDDINLPIIGFTNYRGREPKSYVARGLSIAGFEIPLNELDVQDIFELRNIKAISFQIQDYYDDDGRYNPEKDVTAFSNTGFLTLAGATIKMAIDAFHFKKPLLASTGVQSTMNIEPVVLQRPNIISYNQLLNDANSQLEIERFQHKEFNFQTSGRALFDIRFGDTFFLENKDLISDTDDSTLGETAKKKIKLVAKRIEYHITKPLRGPGGITRSIKGIKRFT